MYDLQTAKGWVSYRHSHATWQALCDHYAAQARAKRGVRDLLRMSEGRALLDRLIVGGAGLADVRRQLYYLAERDVIRAARRLYEPRFWRRRDAAISAAARVRQPGRITEMDNARRARLAAGAIVPLGDMATEMLGRVQAIETRLRNWSLGARAGRIAAKYGPPAQYSIESRGSNSDWSKASTFRRGAVVHSVAGGDRRVMVYRLWGRDYTIIAPRGYRWAIDAEGLCLRGAAGEYHPTAPELIAAASDRCRELVAALKDRAATRRQHRAKAKQQQAMIRRAEREGATVCLADSVRAGNCRAGSETWSRNHGLDPTQHVTPSRLLALANGDTARVAIVVASALRRHMAEMDRGYTLLAEHRIG